MKKQQSRLSSAMILPSLICLLLGMLIGAQLIAEPTPPVQLASVAEKQVAQQQISKRYLDKSSVGCTDPSDPIKPQDRTEVFKRYLRVNGYANRAVIRGCNDIDSLLYKDNSGNWLQSTVNMSLDRRANPKWQKQCLIQDITNADDVVRPENQSIDDENYRQCKELPL